MDSAVFRDSVTGEFRDSNGPITEFPAAPGGGDLPDPSGEPDGQWLRTASGAAVWVAATAADIPFVPAGTISATNVQDAIEEVMTEAGTGIISFDRATRSTDLAPSATTAATAQDYIVGNAITYDGTTDVVIECFIPFTNAADSAHELTLNLWDGGTDLGSIGKFDYSGPCYVAAPVTPSAAIHTYKIKAWRSGGTGGRQFSAGAASASGVLFDSFYRIVRA